MRGFFAPRMPTSPPPQCPGFVAPRLRCGRQPGPLTVRTDPSPSVPTLQRQFRPFSVRADPSASVPTPQYARTSAASTVTDTALLMRSTESTSLAFGPFFTRMPTTPFSGPCTTSTREPSFRNGHGSYLQPARHQPPDALHLDVGHRRQLAVERHDRRHAVAGHHAQRITRVEPGEAVAGEQRPVDLLAAVLPAAPAGDGGEKDLDALRGELVVHGLLGARPRPHGVPRQGFRLSSHHQEGPAPSTVPTPPSACKSVIRRGLTRGDRPTSTTSWRSGRPQRAGRTASSARRSSTR